MPSVIDLLKRHMEIPFHHGKLRVAYQRALKAPYSVVMWNRHDEADKALWETHIFGPLGPGAEWDNRHKKSNRKR